MRDIQRAALIFNMLVVMAAIFAGLTETAVGEPADTITVNTIEDELNNDGDCSLREAVQAANSESAVDACPAGSGADTIDLPAGTYMLSLGASFEDGNTEGDLDISGVVSIVGSDVDTTIIKAGTDIDNAIDRIFHVLSSGHLTVQGLTIRNGGTIVGENILDGGAIYVDSGGQATINDCLITENFGVNCGAVVGLADSTIAISNSVISNNLGGSGGGMCSRGSTTIDAVTFDDNTGMFGGALMTGGGTVQISNSTFSNNNAEDFYFEMGEGYGGAIQNSSDMTIHNCTFSGNSSLLDGGAIRNFGVLSINGSTFSGNEAPNGGGILNLSGQVSVTNSIIANSIGADCVGGITSTGYNIDSDDTCNLTAAGDQPGTSPILGPLQDNGGFTWTHALLTGSPAIDAGDNSACLATDQRGVTRPVDGDDNGSEICDIGAFELTSATALDLMGFKASIGADSSALILLLPAVLALAMHQVFKRRKRPTAVANRRLTKGK